MSQQSVDALKQTIRRLDCERLALAAIVEAMFERLRRERENQDRLYHLGYKHGLRKRDKTR